MNNSTNMETVSPDIVDRKDKNVEQEHEKCNGEILFNECHSSDEKEHFSRNEEGEIPVITDKNVVAATLDENIIGFKTSNVVEESKQCSSDCSSNETGDQEMNHINAGKVRKILKALTTSDVDNLKKAAVSKAGLISDDIRRKVWPKLIGVDIYATSPRPTAEEIEKHPYYNQVVLDVNRSLKRFPPSIKEKQRLAMQDQLVVLIMRVLNKHPHLHYYQGYHDICVTVLLVLGEEMGFNVVESLSLSHLNVFMEKDMEATIKMLSYMYPILERENLNLAEFLDKSDVGVLFSLSWLITWFGHVLNNYTDVVRLFDFFIASDPWMPVYLSTALVLHRETEILQQDCDMACIHMLLSDIPDDMPFEDLITKCLQLYKLYPPKSLEKDVLANLQKKKDNLRPRTVCRTGLIYSIKSTVHNVIQRQKITVSVVLAATVLFSAIFYQAYKSH